MTKKYSAGVVCITPFDTNGGLDEAALRSHLHRLGDAGLSIWAAGSGTSEGYSLNDDEIQRILRIAVDELGGTVPVRAMGREPRTPSEMVEFVKMVQPLGVDAVQIYSLDPGHLYKPTTDEIRAYLDEVLPNVYVPAVLSTHMSVGYLLPVDLIVDVADRYPQVQAINVSTADNDYLRRVIEAVDGRLEVISGGAANALQNLAFGGNGFASSEANLVPRLSAAIIAAYERADMHELLDTYAKVARVSAITMAHGYVSGMKAALAAYGLPGGVPRKPRHPLPDEVGRAIRAELDLLDIDELRAVAV